MNEIAFFYNANTYFFLLLGLPFYILWTKRTQKRLINTSVSFLREKVIQYFCSWKGFKSIITGKKESEEKGGRHGVSLSLSLSRVCS